MQIGHLNGTGIGLLPQMTAYRLGGKIALPADSQENGLYCWKWEATHATGVELHFDFGCQVFLSRLELKLGIDSRLTAAEVWIADPSHNALRCVGAHRTESGQDFGENTSVVLSQKAQYWILRLYPTMSDLVLSIPAFYGAIPEAHTLYPTPCRVEWLNGTLPKSVICAAKAGDSHEDCLFALSYLRESIAERWTMKPLQGNGLILEHSNELPADGYRLSLRPESARLTASTRLGLLYGIERLFELANADTLPCCFIEDAPYKEMRGIHMYLPHRSQLAFTKKLWKSVLIPFHYNMIFLEIAGGMRYESHPEISEGWLRGNRLSKEGKIPSFPHGSVAEGELLEKDEVRELCNFARELGFELIPEVQSLGHVQYITFAHPDIAEFDPTLLDKGIDARDADVPPSLFYRHSYCPQNPKSYEIIFDLMDEIIEVTRPRRFVHMGHDEVYQLGICPKCKNTPQDVLFEQDLLKLHAHLAKHGLRMMIWSDMLQPVTKYQSWRAAERLPRDIVMLDFIWYFHLDKNIEENLLKHGYEVMIGNLYSSHFPRYEHRIPALLGGEVSFWCKTNEESIAREGKFYDMLYTAEMLWSKSYRHELRELYAARIAERLPAVRDRLRGMASTKRTYTPVMLPENRQKLPILFLEACREAGYTPIGIDDGVTIAVNDCTDALRFTHTTLHREKRIAWKPLVRAGAYLVRYADGTEQEIPVTYDGNIRCYRYRFGEPLAEKYYRHEGYVAAWEADPVDAGCTEDGTPVTLMTYEWRNPRPDQRIIEIRCAEYAESIAGLVLCGVDRVNYR